MKVFAGDNAGLTSGARIAKEDVERAWCWPSLPRSSRTPTSRRGLRALEGEGGRHTPFFNGYRSPVLLPPTDVTGSAKLPAGTEMCMPGDNIQLEITLHTPVAMEKGLRFAIREGGRTVGAGTSPRSSSKENASQESFSFAV